MTAAVTVIARVVTRADGALRWCGTQLAGDGDDTELLAGAIYAYAYVFGAPRPIDICALSRGVDGRRYDLAPLSAANRGNGRRLHVSDAVRFSRGRVSVRWRGIRIDVPANRVSGRGVCSSPERRNAQPGFYLALGDEEIPPATPVARIYWNVSSVDEAAALVAHLTEGLAGLPFDLKVATTQQGLRRADAAVLYLPVHCLDAAATVIGSTHRALPLADPVPLWTRRLASGVGLAEDPGDGMSFGQQRAGQAARAIVAGLDAGGLGDDVVLAAFAAAGVRSDAPHLQPGGALNDAMIARLA